MEQRKYTAREEFANAFTHLLAALMAIYGIVMLVANSRNAVQTASTAIFGISLFFQPVSWCSAYTMTNEEVKRIFQKIDHSAIYMLIAGTYTPVLVLTVKFPFDIILVASVWALAIIGIVFSCITVKSKRLATALYLLMGWLSVFFIYNVWMASHLSVWLMLGGGLFYSLGCAFYLMKIRYMHSIWHLFVIAGAVTHFFAIMELLKAVN